MNHQPEDILLPGDELNRISSKNGVTLIGPGLKPCNQPNVLKVTKPGTLQYRPEGCYWIESCHKRYIPKRGDLVIGTVTKRSGDSIKLDIGAPELASLSLLSFEGATKKQKPDVKVGDLIYGKLLTADKEMEPEMVCIDKYFKAGNMGILNAENDNGLVVDFPPAFAVKLLDPENDTLRTLGKKIPYEIVIGVNGKVWVNSKKVDDTLTIVKALRIKQKHYWL